MPGIPLKARHLGRRGEQPERLADDLERLGPTFVKLGQLLSTRPDFLPPAYTEALSRLHEDYSGSRVLAIVLFLAAVAGGVGFVVNSVYSDEKRQRQPRFR